MPELLVGPAAVVPCPVCHARVGRKCTDKRGYLYRGGVHATRYGLWLEAEEQEAERRRARAARQPQASM